MSDSLYAAMGRSGPSIEATINVDAPLAEVVAGVVGIWPIVIVVALVFLFAPQIWRGIHDMQS